MQTSLVRTIKALSRLVVVLATGQFLYTAAAQPANDNFANAVPLEGISAWVIAGDTTGATRQPGEPAHAGFATGGSIWYSWTAPQDGEIAFDTFGSSVDTVVAVYSGTNLTTLNQVAANDFATRNGTWNVGSLGGLYPGTVASPVAGYQNPAAVRFVAVATRTYYIAVQNKGAAGPTNLRWSYLPSGAFRFATDTTFVSSMEGYGTRSGTVGKSLVGAHMAVTRVAGSTGRMRVKFHTEVPAAVPGGYVAAVPGMDYMEILDGELVFDHLQNSQDIVIPIYDSGPNYNRMFNVVIDSVTPDDLEAPEVQAPILDSYHVVNTVAILDAWVDPLYLNLLPLFTNNVVNFEKSYYRTTRGVGTVRIYVERNLGGPAAHVHYSISSTPQLTGADANNQDALFQLEPGSDYATPDPITDPPQGIEPDYTPVEGTLSWGDGDATAKPIDIPIINNRIPQFNEDLRVKLFLDNTGPHVELGYIRQCTVTILFDTQPAGALEASFNPDYDIFTQPNPNQPHPGANGTVNALVVQPDDKSIIAGSFDNYNGEGGGVMGVYVNNIARLNFSGSRDTTFDTGIGADGTINALALTGLQVVVGGAFRSFNGYQVRGITQLNFDGSVDQAFNANIGPGTDGDVYAVVVQPDGKIIVGGDFTQINGTNRTRIARLNSDGTLDTTFDPGLNGPDAVVRAVAVQENGSIIVGGQFNYLGGVSHPFIARYTSSGVVDASFNPTPGFDGAVNALAILPGGRIFAAGSFRNVNGVSRSRIARLNSDGSTDTSFQTGYGFNGDVNALKLLNDGRIYVCGLFTAYNGTRRTDLARLFSDGSLDTGFMDTAYNQFAGPMNYYYNPIVIPPTYLQAIDFQSDGDLMIGGSFNQVGGGRLNAGSIQTNEWVAEAQSRFAVRNRSNVARLVGGTTPGPGNMAFVRTGYSVNESQAQLLVTVTRTNGVLGAMAANFSLPNHPLGTGVAESGTDYVYNSIAPEFVSSHFAGWMTRMISQAWYGYNNVSTNIFDLTYALPYGLIKVTIPKTSFTPNRDVNMLLDVPSGADLLYLGGESIPVGAALNTTRSSANLTIINDDKRPGVISFAQPVYSADENSTNAIISLMRTNGSYGSITVAYGTTNFSNQAVFNAIPRTNNNADANFYPTNFTVTFLQGETNKSFKVGLIHNPNAQPDLQVGLFLAQPKGTTVQFGSSNAALTIVDVDYLPGHINFTPTNYSVAENARAVSLTVTRTGGSQSALTAQYATTNQSAVAGLNYVATNGVLSWNSGDATPRTITVPVLDDGVVTNNKAFTVQLYNIRDGASNPLPGAFGPRTNASVTVINTDAYGTFQFLTATNWVNKNGGYTAVTVTRTSGSAENVAVSFATANLPLVNADSTINLDRAMAGTNYVSTNGTLFFGPGEVSKSFNVQILDQGVTNCNVFRFVVKITALSPVGSIFGTPSTNYVAIVDNNLVNTPAGTLDSTFNTGDGMDGDVYALALQTDVQGQVRVVAVGDFSMVNYTPRRRVARLFSDGSLDMSFLAGQSGVSGQVRTLINQTDNRLVIGGAFANVNGVNFKNIARLNYDGSLDSGFNVGAGTDNPVYAVAETWVNGSRGVFIGGAFTLFNGVGRNSIARLNENGSLDTGFNPGLGANNIVYALAVYPTNTVHGGKVIIGGDFTTINGVPYKRIARLNVDGTVDTSFNPGLGADAAVRAIAIQPDGGILIGGSFTNVSTFTKANGIARLTSNGSIDPTFTPQPGANGTVFGFAIQADLRILVVGEFTTASGVTRRRITRLMPDGKVDPTINFGLGANSFINAIAVQPDLRMVIGGGFTDFNGTPQNRIARIYGGSMTGPGSFEFILPDYSAQQSATNALITIRRIGGTSGVTPGGKVSVLFTTANNTAFAGTNYVGVTNTIEFPEGEVFSVVSVGLLNDQLITPNRTVDLRLSNPLPLGGPALGPQPIATLTIVNDNSAVNFLASTYTATKGNVDGAAWITVTRGGYLGGTSTVDFMTTFGGTAIQGLDYTGVTNTVTFLAGQSSAITKVPLINNSYVRGNKTVALRLANSIGALLLNPDAAVLTIVDNTTAPGQLAYSAASYAVLEDAGSARITVLRTNGHTGVVTVKYITLPNTAVPGVNFIPTNGTLTFGDGETTKSFDVTVLNDGVAGYDKTVLLVLTNFTGGATMAGSPVETLTVVENNRGFALTSSVYAVGENGGSVTIGVRRLGSTNGIISVDLVTTNGTATNGVDYAGMSNRLVFLPAEMLKLVTIAIIPRPGVQGDRNFKLGLMNESTNTSLTSPKEATVYILDSDTGFSLTSSNFSVLKSVTNLTISVVRTNPDNGTASVMYATSDATAVAGVNYTPVFGTLNFNVGESLKTFDIPILSNNFVLGDMSFNVQITNASPATNAWLIPPSTATVTIVDDTAGVRFSSSLYSVNKNGVTATVHVFRENYTTNFAAVTYQTQDGTALAGQDYLPASGMLMFPPGVTNASFQVTIINNTITRGNHTVLLSLSNPNNSTLINPSAATLTIVDNGVGDIAPAGSALVAESQPPPDGVIYPGETVTVLLALRNTVGRSTTNLVATLLATNGVTLPSGPQTYGALAAGGPSVFRPYSFTAVGTNGQQISAVLKLQDGGLDMGYETFLYTLGSKLQSFTNNNLTVIPDAGTATPYPSTNVVSGLDGVVSKVTLTLSNLYHTYPDDINVLLVSPAGQKVVVMGGVGGAFAVTNITLTLDDTATNALPKAGPLISGKFQPANYRDGINFPSPAPAMAYDSTLSVFKGGNPNGVWSLYVMDTSAPDGGGIGGWTLAISTVKPVVADTDLALTLLGDSGPIVVSSNVTYTLIVNNYGPGTATSVLVTNLIARTASYVASAPTQGVVTTNGAGLVTWQVGSLATNATATLVLTVKTSKAGTITNLAGVFGDQADPNLVNNKAEVVSTVVTPTADLALGLVDSPDQVPYTTNAITYSVSITNLGPATATGVTLTNVLPTGVVFVPEASSPFLVNQGGVLIGNLGYLASGAKAFVTIVLRPTVTGTITNTVGVFSPVLDPIKGNNVAAVKTVVAVPLVVVSRAGTNLVLAWPADAVGYTLKSTTNLVQGVNWVPVTDGAAVVGPMKIVTIPITSTNRFFRLETAP